MRASSWRASSARMASRDADRSASFLDICRCPTTLIVVGVLACSWKNTLMQTSAWRHDESCSLTTLKSMSSFLITFDRFDLLYISNNTLFASERGLALVFFPMGFCFRKSRPNSTASGDSKKPGGSCEAVPVFPFAVTPLLVAFASTPFLFALAPLALTMLFLGRGLGAETFGSRGGSENSLSRSSASSASNSSSSSGSGVHKAI
mmetsp:Transcript_135123/g.337105  ORF Transcript_135123/g.337105 Transcript_135123/m.337105 type:complete len:205 (+) Transcript_135123:26-640(+)